MKKLVIISVLCLFVSLAFGQTEVNNFKLNYNGGYSATPQEIITVGDVTDTVRFAEMNYYSFGGGAYLNSGLGLEFNKTVVNRYYDTLAGDINSYSVGIGLRKCILGPGSLFDNGFNMFYSLSGGYFHSTKVDAITYIDSTSTSVWKREKTSKGWYANGKVEIFKDNPSFATFYGGSLGINYVNPIRSTLRESRDDVTTNAKWDSGDSVNIINISLELKPLIIPLNEKVGLSLIGGIDYNNFNSYQIYDKGWNWHLGLALDGFTNFGECARITYSRINRETFVSNEFNFSIEVVQACKVIFGK